MPMTEGGPKSRIYLVLGGVSSGKSAFAEKMIDDMHQKSGGSYYYFTPAGAPQDEEMRAKVAVHRERRPDWLKTVECGTAPAEALKGLQAGDTVLFDSAGTLVSRFLLDELDPGDVAGAAELFISEAARTGISVVFVSEEVGMTLVPVSEWGRLFQKVLGRLNQFIAASADEVYLITAGLPQKLK